MGALKAFVMVFLSVFCADAARLRRRIHRASDKQGTVSTDSDSGTPSKPVEAFGQYPNPAKKSPPTDGDMEIITPVRVTNDFRTPKPGKKATSVRAADNWVVMREGEDSYNSTGDYSTNCCVICAPNSCGKSKCPKKNVCKKTCGASCLVPSKGKRGPNNHHMVQGYETMHSSVAVKEIVVPNPDWARAPLKPISQNGATEEKSKKDDEDDDDDDVESDDDKDAKKKDAKKKDAKGDGDKKKKKKDAKKKDAKGDGDKKKKEKGAKGDDDDDDDV